MEFDKFPENEQFVYNHMKDVTFTRLEQHYHNLLEIYVMEDGECNYFIGDKLYEVKAGDVIIIPQNTLHKAVYTTPTHSRMLINCSGRYIPLSVLPELKNIVPQYRNEKIYPQIYSIMTEIEKEYFNSDKYSDEAISYLTGMLFFTLLRNMNTCSKIVPQNIHIGAIIAYIRKNYAEPMTLREVAAKFSLSPEHVSRTFRKETGFGFSEYITLVRMQQAKNLLMRDKKVSISEAAFRCGFNDSNYFSYRFRKIFGFSPSALKNK